MRGTRCDPKPLLLELIQRVNHGGDVLDNCTDIRMVLPFETRGGETEDAEIRCSTRLR